MNVLITNLYFVRHAHSTYTPDELKRPLSQRGVNDAKFITELLKQENIDKVFSSPYKRAIQTVEGIAKLLGKEIELMEDFKERTLSEHPVTDFSEAISKVWANFDFSLEGGESNHVAQKRGVAATFQILDKYKGQNIVIGTHGNIMALIMNYFDQRYDVHFWEQLKMPDIYKLSFDENHLIEVTRVDDEYSNRWNTGYTIFQSIGIQIDYPSVDLEKKMVTGVVTFENKVYMTVLVDLQTDSVKAEGSINDLAHLVSIEHLETEYIAMIKNMAKFFIENKISNPKEYYENLITEQEK